LVPPFVDWYPWKIILLFFFKYLRWWWDCLYIPSGKLTWL
jgi:hypothetical protein